ncbi:MAG: BatA and WFA domain-containing protein [Vicinamibacterales bacterium]
MSFLAPLFLMGLAVAAIPVFVHLIQRERKDVIEFPSLMFIRRIPYQSVERRRIHNWWLLALRLAALALIVAAFARPFFKVDPVRAAASALGARDVVILLDRSASMGYGDHWTRAQNEARQIVSGLHGDDRATLVLFERNAEEAVRLTSDAGSLRAAIANAKVSSGSTRFAPALRLAQSLLSRSDRPRKEAYLISDFQRSGWERQEEIRLPEGATIAPVSVAEPATTGVAVTSVNLQRASFSGQERVTISAGISNKGSDAAHPRVSLEIDGRPVAAQDVALTPHGTGSVTFEPVTVAESNMRGVIRAGTDPMPKDNDFYFVLSPSRPMSVLVINGEGADRTAGLYLSTVFELAKAPPMKSEVVTAARLTPALLTGRSLVVLNDTSTLSTVSAELLKSFVERGGGLLIALGDRSPVSGEWPLLPGTLGAPVDRLSVHGGTLGYVDYSHPIFEEFKDPRSGNFSNMRFLKYRGLAPGPTDHVLARYDDGGTALVERKVGTGRVIALTSTLDGSWNDAPTHGMFLPLMHQVARYLAQYQDPEPWHLVGRMLDISAPIGSVVREGQATTRLGAGVVVSPSGAQVTLGSNGVRSIELAEQGFYSVRLSGSGDRRPYEVAVNIDPVESDLTSLPAAEFLAAATNRPAAVQAGQSLEPPAVTPVDLEKKQSIWWFLLVGGLVALFAESVLANRKSRLLGFGTRQGRQAPAAG